MAMRVVQGIGGGCINVAGMALLLQVLFTYTITPRPRTKRRLTHPYDIHSHHRSPTTSSATWAWTRPPSGSATSYVPQTLQLPNPPPPPNLQNTTPTPTQHPQKQKQLGPPLGALLYAYMGFRNLNLVLGAIPLAELLAFPCLAPHIPSAAKGAGASDSAAPTPACTPLHAREEAADGVVPRSA